MTIDMRRAVAAALALLVVNASVLQAGMLCRTAATQPPTAAAAPGGHMGHAPPAPASGDDHRPPARHHGDTDRCALMAACFPAGLIGPPATIGAAPSPDQAMHSGPVAALVSITAAPETPPPRT